MLPAGARSTYSLPPSPRPDERDLAKQILASIRGEIRSSQELRLGIATTGCDGMPTINPLDGTLCSGDVSETTSACDLVLYNPQTRSQVTKTVGRAFSSSLASCQQAVLPPTGLNKFTYRATPPDCTDVAAALRTRRRFTDNLGNVYGPDGAWLSSGATPATLNADYVHRMIKPIGVKWTGDPPVRDDRFETSLDKVSGVAATFGLIGPIVGIASPAWPSVNDLATQSLLWVHDFGSGLDDVEFFGSYTAPDRRLWTVTIDGVGSPNTFGWGTDAAGGYAVTTHAVPITGALQTLSYGVSVRFASTTGHTLNDIWDASAAPNNDMTRRGVAARGTITAATPCVNGGFPNCNVILTSEDDVQVSPSTTLENHALVVRNADSLAQLYRLALAYDGTAYSFGLPGQLFSFSANDEGKFFMQCYTNPSLTSPPSPFPGAEFGAPNPRKVAVVSVDPLTFEPTIDELITLEDNEYTRGSTFAVAMTVP